MHKCPQCGGYDVAPITPPDGTTHYFLPSINVTTKDLNIDTGMPVSAFGCVSCKAVFFKNESLKRN